MKVFNIQGDFKVLKCDPVKLKDKEGKERQGYRLVITQNWENNYVVFSDKAFPVYSETGKEQQILFSSISVYYKDGVEHAYFNI